MKRMVLPVAFLCLLQTLACSDETTTSTDAIGNVDGLAADGAIGDGVSMDSVEPDWGSEDCDPLMPQRCSLPWPSNLYLVEDESRETGVTLTFGPTTLPANRDGQHINPEAWKRLDGWMRPEAVVANGV